MNRTIAWLAALVLVAVASFGNARGAPARQDTLPPEVIGVEWTLTSLQPSGAAAEDTTGLGLTLTLGADGSASGSGGCNRFVTGYTVGANDSLSFSVIAGTLIACEAPIAEREQRYFSTLEGVSAYSFENGQLKLTSGDSGELVYASAGGQPSQLPATGADSWALWLLLAAAACGAAGLGVRWAVSPRTPQRPF